MSGIVWSNLARGVFVSRSPEKSVGVSKCMTSLDESEEFRGVWRSLEDTSVPVSVNDTAT